MKNKELIDMKGLSDKILKASNIIAKKQRFGTSSYMITSSKVVNVIKIISDDLEMIEKQELRLKKLKNLLDEY